MKRIVHATLFFLALAVVHTWPLATDPAHLSRNDAADAQLNAWIVSWVAHQAVRDPIHLFDANIFYPERRTLAFSEPLIVPGLLGAPIRWAGGSPVLTYNLLLLSGFVLTALAMYALARRFTGSHVGGLFAGSVLAFNAHTMTRLPHLQAIHAEFLPLAFWAFDRILTGNRTRDAFWLALFVLLVTLTSGYLAMFTLFGLAAAFLARPDDWWGGRARSVLGRLGLAAALSAAIALPVMWPYNRVRSETGLNRSLGTVSMYSTSPWAYLNTVSRLHFPVWSHRVYRRIVREKFFPGLTAYALAVLALTRREAFRDPRIRMLIAVAGVGMIYSFGVGTPVYRWTYATFPPLQGLRAAARFGYLVLFAVAGLTAFGMARLERRFASRVWWSWAAGLALFAVNVESLHAPYEFRRFAGFPKLYKAVAREPGRVVLAEFPLYSRNRIHENADYVLASTEHWKPLLNGYSGFTPPSYRAIAGDLQEFPSSKSLDLLRTRGVTHVMVHPTRYPRAKRPSLIEALSATERVELVALDQDGAMLYRLREVRPVDARVPVVH